MNVDFVLSFSYVCKILVRKQLVRAQGRSVLIRASLFSFPYLLLLLLSQSLVPKCSQSSQTSPVLDKY